MKRLVKWTFILALTLAAHARAADGGSPDFYTGTVVDEQGRPVAGATVEGYYHQSFEGFGYIDREPELTQRTVTDSNGVFTVLSAPGSILAVVKKPGLAPAWKTWPRLLEDWSEPLVLTAPAALAGTVLDENNQPVAGAEVWVAEATKANETGWAGMENQLTGKPARECFSTKTAADGRFRIGNFPAGGQARLAVKITGKARCPFGNPFDEAWPFRSGNEDIQLRVGPAGAVEGKVIVAETGEPLQGVKIKLEPTTSGLYGSEYRETIESGADGAFRIPDVQPGRYVVTPFIPGQPVPDWVLSVDSQVTVVAGETARGVVINASKGALVEVSVVLTNELTPLVGVPVWSFGSTVYTGINGMALFRVPVGKNYFSTRNDWTSQDRQADIQAGRITNIWIELIPPPTLSGIVRDPAGAPVAGALVSFHPGSYPDAPDYSEVTTDKNGRYEIILRLSREDSEWDGPISETDCVIARDLKRNLVATREFVKIPANLDLNLIPGLTLSGVVTDPAGAPVSNAVVNFAFLSSQMMVKWKPCPDRTDARGLFSFPALPQGQQYYLGIAAAGYGEAYLGLKKEETQTNHFEFPAVVLNRAGRKPAGQGIGP